MNDIAAVPATVVETVPGTDRSREWLVTNGLGGYAAGTVAGVNTRRYHALLVAALPAPLGRTVMFNRAKERLVLPDGRRVPLANDPTQEAGEPAAAATFRLEMGLPVWRYQVDGIVVERRIIMPYLQNTTHVLYRLVEGAERLTLSIRPAFHFRPHEQPVGGGLAHTYRLTAEGQHYEVSAGPDLPVLRFTLGGEHPSLLLDGGSTRDVFYPLEAERGYESRGLLWSPGTLQVTLMQGHGAALTTSTEPWHNITALSPEEAEGYERQRRRRLLDLAGQRDAADPAGQLVLAADQFLITPVGRVADAARAHARGDEVRTVIAGYYWFTDWGRDTMISLEGLTLATGRHLEGGSILRHFAHYIRDGLIPNMFPEGREQGLYNTADASLWFFHAMARYLAVTGDRITLRQILPKLVDIAEHHVRGTRFGIGADPRDGLLREGAEGLQLTWMDAKVGDWVVTPRRGKPVEINALWYNALCLLGRWLGEEKGVSCTFDPAALAERVRRSFNERFWYAPGSYLYDVIDGEHGDDPALRPNQIFAISLPHPVLDEERWRPVVEICRRELLTPVGLRSLAPGHPDFKPRYFGDLRARDAAYHQGTVWLWLIGPYIDACRKTFPADTDTPAALLRGLVPHLGEAGMGTMSEVADAEPPFTPRGCIAQAWSVAEALRCWVALERGQRPEGG